MDLYKEALQEFKTFFAKALQSDIKEPTAMTLATVGEKGQPSARLVLLKDIDDQGFVFYTNMKSQKGMDLKKNPQAALCFWWPSLDSQIRVEGTTEAVAEKEADKYWATRPRESQLGAWASQQSEVLSERSILLNRYEELEKKYGNRPIPRPPYWTGYRVIPHKIEFWYAKPHRLHERIVYQKESSGWKKHLLYP